MKPTITNAFTGALEGGASSESTRAIANSARSTNPLGETRHPLKSLAASLTPMLADLRETEFGWSLELSPMSAIDALGALNEPARPELQYLVSMEQSTWRDGEGDLPLATMARRLCIEPIDVVNEHQLVLDEIALRQLVSLCQPTRLLVTAVEGPIEGADSGAINRAIDGGHSPLLAEVRAVFALEVLGDRNVVLHCRTRRMALALVADNFRHYLAALTGKCAARYSGPQHWQVERLLDETGVLTVRPIETELMATSVDVGVNTSRQRFDQPANRSLIYDIHSDTWHDEP